MSLSGRFLDNNADAHVGIIYDVFSFDPLSVVDKYKIIIIKHFGSINSVYYISMWYNVYDVVIIFHVEYKELRSYLRKSGLSLYRLRFSASQIAKYSPGGEAIVDQWICAHAR